jgi:hypothetical protein
MTKISPRRIGSTLLAAVSFTAFVTTSLLAAPAALAESAPSADSLTNQAGYVRPVTASKFQSGIGTLDFAACPDRRACLFTGADYTLGKLVLEVTDLPVGEWAGPFHLESPDGPIITWRSAKNTFDNRRLQIARELADGSKDVLRCLDPNTNRPGPFPDGSRFVRIGVLDSRC